MSLEILKKDLKEKKLKSVYLFFGPEEYLKKYYLNAITECILSNDTKDLNYIFSDGKIEEQRIIQNCETLPVFSDKKIIAAKNTGLFKSQKSEDKGDNPKGQKNSLEEYIQKMPEFSCLIFIESEVDKRKKLVNTIKKYGLAVEFEYQKPADLTKWVIKVFKSNGKDIDTMTASYIVENSEYSMTELLNEIQKLVTYSGENNLITIDDAQLVCTKTIKSRIFDLTDAVSEGNISKALILLNDMASLKEPIQKVMFMIIRQIRMVFRVKLLKQQGLPDGDISKELGLTPYVASKVIRLSRNLSAEVLENAVYYSAELDQAVKSGRMSDRTAVELLIASLEKQ